MAQGFYPQEEGVVGENGRQREEWAAKWGLQPSEEAVSAEDNGSRWPAAWRIMPQLRGPYDRCSADCWIWMPSFDESFCRWSSFGWNIAAGACMRRFS